MLTPKCSLYDAIKLLYVRSLVVAFSGFYNLLIRVLMGPGGLVAELVLVGRVYAIHP